VQGLTHFAGSIIAGALCVNGWGIDDCIAAFKSLAHMAFQSRSWLRIPLLSQILRVPFLSAILQVVMLLVADSRYSASNLEKALKHVFGSAKSIMDCSAATEMGIMMGVTVSTVWDTQACVFTNYNGKGVRKAPDGAW